MKTEQEIRETFHEMVVQRDSCTQGSSAHEILNQRLRALAWVIGHPLVAEILLSEDALDLLDCVG